MVRQNIIAEEDKKQTRLQTLGFKETLLKWDHSQKITVFETRKETHTSLLKEKVEVARKTMLYLIFDEQHQQMDWKKLK